jgi:hypothetical protein
MPGVGHVSVALQAGPDSMRGPQVISGGVEERVPFALEGGFAGSLPEKEACSLEPATEVTLFRLSLGVGEAGERNDAVLHDSSVSYEDHIGQSLLTMDQANIRHALQVAVQLLPLGEGEIS